MPVAVSGLALFLAFALISYFFPAAGVSDMGTFAGNLLHGRGGDLLERKVSSNVGSLTLTVFSWLIPVAAVAAAAALWRPAALRLRPLARRVRGRAAGAGRSPGSCWLVLVIGWFADDSGVIVPAAALPFAVPLVISMAASVSAAVWRGTLFWYRLRRVFRRRQTPEVRQRTPECSTSFRVSSSVPALHVLGRPEGDRA